MVTVAPHVSAIVTVSWMSSVDPLPSSECWYTTSPAGVAATLPTPEVSWTDSRSSGSPSGSTQPARTGTVTVPPRATSGSGHVTRHPGTPHQVGADSWAAAATVSVTVVGAERSPPALVPSVAA